MSTCSGRPASGSRRPPERSAGPGPRVRPPDPGERPGGRPRPQAAALLFETFRVGGFDYSRIRDLYWSVERNNGPLGVTTTLVVNLEADNARLYGEITRAMAAGNTDSQWFRDRVACLEMNLNKLSMMDAK
jgi:hypothetical protein